MLDLGADLLDRQTLRERVTDRLRDRIMDGTFAPGTVLAEAQIARLLNVSRGTAREALRGLETEGLVDWEARQSPQVRILTRSDIAELYAVRALLEADAAARVAKLPTGPRRAAVLKLEEAYQALAATAHPDVRTRIEADLAFHELLCTLSQNRTLLLTWRQLVTGIRRVLLQAPTEALNSDAGLDHTDLIEAIRRGSAKAAHQHITRHFALAPDLYYIDAGPGAQAIHTEVHTSYEEP